MYLAVLGKLSVSYERSSVGLSVCVFVGCCVFVWTPCPCLRLMSRPLRGWHWTAVPFWTIALARVSDNTTSSVLSPAPSLFLSCSDRTIIHRSCFLPYGSMISCKNMSCSKWKLLFGVWPALSCSNSAYFIAHWEYMSTLVGQHWKEQGCDWHLAQVVSNNLISLFFSWFYFLTFCLNVDWFLKSCHLLVHTSKGRWYWNIYLSHLHTKHRTKLI